MSKKQSLSPAFQQICGITLAMSMSALATMALAAGDDPAEKTGVPYETFCTMQEQEFAKPDRNLAPIFQNYSPYRQNVIDIPVTGTRHGDITLRNFDCDTLLVYCPSQQGRQLLVTEGALSVAHAGLGSLNNSDPDTVRRAMAVLAKSTRTVTTANEKALEHLSDYHGLNLFTVDRQAGTVIMSGQMAREIVPACVAQLDR